MPGHSSNRVALQNSDTSARGPDGLRQFLEELAQGLERELCAALLAEETELAERLNVYFVSARKQLARMNADRVATQCTADRHRST